MKSWKQAMQTYTGYIKKEFELTPELYYDVFTNLCEPEMRKKLDGIKDIKKLGEAKIWDIIEGIWVESNPMYTRRLKAIDLKMEKGEEVGYFFNRLKNQFDEAEMEKATPWTLFICKLINSIPESGNDAISLKNKLSCYISKLKNIHLSIWPQKDDLYPDY